MNAYLEANGGITTPTETVLFPVSGKDDKTLKSLMILSMRNMAVDCATPMMDSPLLLRMLQAYINARLLRLPALLNLFGLDALLAIYPLIKFSVSLRQPWTSFNQNQPFPSLAFNEQE